MAYQYLLSFLLREQHLAVEFEVRESHWRRARNMFEMDESFFRPARFLIFDTVEGLTVAVGYSDVQLVRFLCNSVDFPSDQKHKDDDVHVWLRGRDKPISIRVHDEKETLSAFFIALDSGAEFGQFPGLIDEDGELVYFNCDDVVFVTAPLHTVSEGHQILKGDSEPDNNGDSQELPF